MAIQVSHSKVGSVLVVVLEGELDGATAPSAEKEIMALVSREQAKVALDMGKVNFMSSAGLRMLLALVRETRQHGGDLRLARPQPAIQDVVQMGFANMVQIFGSVPGAIASFDPQALNQEPAGGGSISGAKVVWNDAFMDQMRMIGDPVADGAIQALFDEGKIEAVNQLMRDLVSNDYIPPSELPPVIRNYLANTADLPVWADSSRIKRGQTLFSRYGMQMVLILFHASLPISYAARKGVHVLHMTQRLNRNPHLRIVETAQMLLDIMAPGGLQQGGNGLRSAQKVRLIHAAVRHLLLKSGHWESELYDYPINQEDLAGTLMCFSYVIVSRLARLGIELTEDDQENYLHVWNVVGHVMGIVPELLPDNMTAAEYLLDLIIQRQVLSSTLAANEGRELTDTLLKMIQDAMPGPFHAMPYALVRHLAGEDIADSLGVEKTSWQNALKPLQWANQLLFETSHHIPIIGSASEAFSRKMLEGLMLYNLGGNRTSFQIPNMLQQDWGLGINS
jgi:anti-anti-sigma factor